MINHSNVWSIKSKDVVKVLHVCTCWRIALLYRHYYAVIFERTRKFVRELDHRLQGRAFHHPVIGVISLIGPTSEPCYIVQVNSFSAATFITLVLLIIPIILLQNVTRGNLYNSISAAKFDGKPTKNHRLLIKPLYKKCYITHRS